jgi:hypothetical protein
VDTCLSEFDICDMPHQSVALTSILICADHPGQFDESHNAGVECLTG